MSLRALSNPVDTFFSGFEEPIPQNSPAFGFVIVQGSTEISRDQPVECQIHNLTSDLGFHFVPGHPSGRIAPHLSKATAGLFGAIINIRKHNG